MYYLGIRITSSNFMFSRYADLQTCLWHINILQLTYFCKQYLSNYITELYFYTYTYNKKNSMLQHDFESQSNRKKSQTVSLPQADYEIANGDSSLDILASYLPICSFAKKLSSELPDYISFECTSSLQTNIPCTSHSKVGYGKGEMMHLTSPYDQNKYTTCILKSNQSNTYLTLLH